MDIKELNISPDKVICHVVFDDLEREDIEHYLSCSVEEVTLPDSVRTIESNAFSGCDNLTRVNIPEGVQTIEPLAFYENAIERIVIPESVTNMGMIDDKQFKCFHGYYKDDHPKVTIVCKRGSAAEKYAKHFELETEYFE